MTIFNFFHFENNRLFWPTKSVNLGKPFMAYSRVIKYQ